MVFYKVLKNIYNCGFISIMVFGQQLLLARINNCGFSPTINAGLQTINQQFLRFYNYKPAIIPTLSVSDISSILLEYSRNLLNSPSLHILIANVMLTFFIVLVITALCPSDIVLQALVIYYLQHMQTLRILINLAFIGWSNIKPLVQSCEQEK